MFFYFIIAVIILSFMLWADGREPRYRQKRYEQKCKILKGELHCELTFKYACQIAERLIEECEKTGRRFFYTDWLCGIGVFTSEEAAVVYHEFVRKHGLTTGCIKDIFAKYDRNKKPVSRLEGGCQLEQLAWFIGLQELREQGYEGANQDMLFDIREAITEKYYHKDEKASQRYFEDAKEKSNRPFFLDVEDEIRRWKE